MSWFVRYWRFSLFLALMVVTGTISFWLNTRETYWRALLVSFDIAAIVFLVTLTSFFRETDPKHMRARAKNNDPDHHTLLWIGSLIIGVVMVAVGNELHDGAGISVALSVFTLAIAWTFGNILFTLHYAHAYYTPDDKGDAEGLQFPSDDTPDHWDFAYFAFVLGMTFQVSDVVITGRRMRRLALVHGLIGFVFNIGVIAISVGIISNLFQGS